MRATNSVTRERDRADRSPANGPRRAPFVVLVLGLLGAGLCALLAINTVAAADEVRQRELSSTNADTLDQAQQLRLEIARKQAPAALASAARALGMVPNPNPAFLVIATNGSASVLGSPVKATAAAKPKPTLTPTPTATATTSVSPPAGTTPTTTPSPPLSPTDPASPTNVTITGAR
jgi:hypothetical protein